MKTFRDLYIHLNDMSLDVFTQKIVGNSRFQCPVIRALPMQFGDNEATLSIPLHHVKRVSGKHKEEIQNLANK